MKRVCVGICIILTFLVVLCKKQDKQIDITSQMFLASRDTVPLYITHISPTGSVEGVYETFKIMVGFNQAMVPLQAIPREETRGPLEINPPLKGKYRWLGSRTLTFIPSDTLQPGTEFTVTLNRDKIQSLTGMRLENDTSWIFESVRPNLLASQPYQNNQFIDIKTNIYLNFNIEMAPNRVGDKIKIIATEGMPSRVYCGKITPKFGRVEKEISFRVRNLRDVEKKDWPLKNWENKNTLVLEPVKQLPREAQIEVHIMPGLLAKTGELGTNQERILRFNTYNYLSLIGYSQFIAGGEGLELCFSNRVRVSDVIQHLTIEPAVDIPQEYRDATWDGTDIYLYMPFKVDTKYTVHIDNALKDIHGNEIDKEYRFTLDIGDYKPDAQIPTGINIIEEKSDLRFPATFINVDSVYVQIGLISIDNAVPFLSVRDLFYSYKKFIPSTPEFFTIDRYWKVNTYKNLRNRQVRRPIELKDILGNKKSGLVFIQFDNLGQNSWSGDYRYLKAFCEVGDLGVTWKYAPENNLVWITSLDDTRPIKNAKVQFRNENNRVLWEGYTDNSGLCELPGWADLRIRQEVESYDYEDEYESYSYSTYTEPKFWLTVLKGNEQAIYSNKWNFGIDLWRFNIPYNWDIRSEEYGASIFTEKGLYRSGESVHIKGIIRKKKKGLWVMPDVTHVNFIIRNSRDEEIVNENIAINQFGSFSKVIQLSDEAPTGVYSITTIVPKKDYSFYQSFRVEAYRPVEFEVRVDAERDTFIAEEMFKGSITGQYLFGMPMREAPVSWNLQRYYHYLSYPQHEGYQFGEYIEEQEVELLGSGSGTLTTQGEYTVSVKLSKQDIYAPSVITLEGTVTAPNQQSVSMIQNWVALNADILIGLKRPQYVYVLGDTVDLRLITVKPSGEKIGDKKVQIEIVKQEWKSIKKARLGGRYEWLSEMVEKEIDTRELTSSIDSTFINFLPDEPGYYYVRAQTKDGKGRLSSTRIYFYVAGQGYAGWQMRDDDMVELVADKDQYDVGDTAKILVKSPYDSARCLVTIERELVLRHFTTTLHGNADYIGIPIELIDLPNVYVCVTLLRGRVKELSWDEEKQEDLGKPQFKIGYVNLKVNTKEKHLKVTTWSDKKDYRPRDSVTVYCEVKNYKNHAVANSEVALFVVDLGVLNLINYQTPDPFAYFYGSRSLSVKTIESRLNILGERDYGEKGEERGGGGLDGDGISYREKFLATVLFKAHMKTDKNGKAIAKFVLPDNLTKFRIMAVSQTMDSKFGSADSIFQVNLPFIMTPSVPRFARVGDDFLAGVVLHNRTDKEEKATVECLAEGLSFTDDVEKEIILPPNGSKEVLFSFTATDNGEAVFSFNAHMGEEKDALRLRIPVILPPFIEAVATFSSTIDSALEGIIVPENIYENLGNLEIVLSSSILAGMQRGIEHLLDYPYYCLEQRLSQILPLIVAEDIINQFKLAPVTGKELRMYVQSILDEVPEYQLYSGGFVYFKDGYIPAPYLSAYTMYVLKQAQQAGYNIEPEVIKRGTEFLREVLRWNDVDWSYPYNVYAKLTTKAFCLYSLALWGRHEASYASRLFEQREQIPLFGKTLLLKTGRLLTMGKRFEDEMVRILLNKVKLTPTTAHFEESENRGWTFPSPAKVTGFVIQTFTELDIPFPYKDQTIRWLVQERTKKSRPTTHENAFVFDAFQTYYKKYEKEEPDFTARIILQEKEIVQQIFKGRTNEPPQRHLFPLDTIPKNKLLPIRITKQGDGRLYYTLRMFYALKENPIAFDEGFYLWKEILTLDDREIRTFTRGEVYKVIVHIVVPETRLFAVVDDPLPAGFVPVQTFFATESRDVREQYWEDQWQERGHWWGSFDHEEYYDDKILLFAQHLFPGEHTKVYYVRAATKGKFLAPSAKAEEMYSPEVFGSTTQNFVTIE
jgi:uncharacterized protein YfaS (alpha-2-macroglobulin family)